jgi:hypothetical protein
MYFLSNPDIFLSTGKQGQGRRVSNQDDIMGKPTLLSSGSEKKQAALSKPKKKQAVMSQHARSAPSKGMDI